MTRIKHKKSIHSIRGVTLVEMGIMCGLIAILSIVGISTAINYARNQNIANDSKLDRQSLQELIRATNNYFIACPHDSSVSIAYLQSNHYLAMSSPLQEITWGDSITATLHNNIAVDYTISANYTGNSAYQTRYADLLTADQSGTTFIWKRAIGTFRSYDSIDIELGPEMGRYIQHMNGAKPCQQ